MDGPERGRGSCCFATVKVGLERECSVPESRFCKKVMFGEIW